MFFFICDASGALKGRVQSQREDKIIRLERREGVQLGGWECGGESRLRGCPSFGIRVKSA